MSRRPRDALHFASGSCHCAASCNSPRRQRDAQWLLLLPDALSVRETKKKGGRERTARACTVPVAKPLPVKQQRTSWPPHFTLCPGRFRICSDYRRNSHIMRYGRKETAFSAVRLAGSSNGVRTPALPYRNYNMILASFLAFNGCMPVTRWVFGKCRGTGRPV